MRKLKSVIKNNWKGLNASIADLQYLVISTPDRDILRGENDFGPPRNMTHMREWNGKEFKNFISSSGFTIVSHMLAHYEQGTQMIICGLAPY